QRLVELGARGRGGGGLPVLAATLGALTLPGDLALDQLSDCLHDLRAVRLLAALGAVDELAGETQDLGELMSSVVVDPCDLRRGQSILCREDARDGDGEHATLERG